MLLLLPLHTVARSKRISNAMSDFTSGSTSPGSVSPYHRQSLGNTAIGYSQAAGGGSPSGAVSTPRRSWSNFAFNNKNFPDGKLNYECQQQVVDPKHYPTHHYQHQTGASSVYGNNGSPGGAGGGAGRHSVPNNMTGANSGGASGAGSKGYGFGTAAARSRFERSGQDVMARASQIVM